MTHGTEPRPQGVVYFPLLIIAFLATPVSAIAQTDEIQVYDANIAEVGKFNLMVHDNFTPSGRTTPAFPGAIISNRALGRCRRVCVWCDRLVRAGLSTFPLYSHSQNQGATYNGFKIRELFVKPHADEQRFFYGLNLRVQRQSEAVGSAAHHIRAPSHHRMAPALRSTSS